VQGSKQPNIVAAIKNQLALSQELSQFIVASIQPQPIYSRYFIIKSYTEEDVHKAIKYQLWSSTKGGNKVLDAAYLDLENLKNKSYNNSDETSGDVKAIQDAQIYLFFSVNQSKQFCGVAKMVSGVNHEEPDNIWTKTGKWVGSFRIELEFIKDIPNTQFIHLENPYNENKPACQGRDCTELYPKTGERMI